MTLHPDKPRIGEQYERTSRLLITRLLYFLDKLLQSSKVNGVLERRDRSVAVIIPAFQAGDPGSTPGGRSFFVMRAVWWRIVSKKVFPRFPGFQRVGVHRCVCMCASVCVYVCLGVCVCVPRCVCAPVCVCVDLVRA